MGYVFDDTDATVYDARFGKPANQHRMALECALMMDLMAPRRGQRILDIGCGTGRSLMPLLNKGYHLTGVDPSPHMLALAREQLGTQVDLHRGNAEDLLFEDNSFDIAFFFTSLEFSNRPAKAIEEACRVAREQVVIGVLNRYAPLNMIRKAKAFFAPDLFTHARFFSLWELRSLVFDILGQVPVKWKTTLQFPCIRGHAATYIESLPWIQKSCCGTFIGMRIKPVPKFRARPLPLKVRERTLCEPATGLIRGMQARERD